MSINKYVDEIHRIAKSKGWWDKPRETGTIHMLCVSEIAEATEAARIGDEDKEAEELVDCVIRICDYFGYKKWNMERILGDKINKNKTRSYRHGGKLF